ncbi:hypothetical protein [Raineyella antarctica]|uniref:hypothetical protein n=1 Tax=Raineyella antarctica TaxID=1577474 RepID=UPI001587FC35|nr:hypothetical protein [Raineyella antarctica]
MRTGLVIGLVALLSACTTPSGGPAPGPTDGTGTPTASGTPAPAPTQSPAPTPTPTATPGGGVADPLVLDELTYLGACGIEAPYRLTPMTGGRQVTPVSMGGTSRRAEVVSSRPVELAGRQLALVELRCTSGLDATRGWHLVGEEGRQVVDLGLVAAGSEATIGVAEDRLVVQLTYPAGRDPQSPGRAKVAYRVALVGSTPVRLFAGSDLGSVPAAVAQWPAQSWAYGLGTYDALALGGGERSLQRQGPVVLDSAERALAPNSMANDLYCSIDPAIVTTTDSSAIRVGDTRTPVDGGGAILPLLTAAATRPTSAAHWTLPLDGAKQGMLVPLNGLAPTPALVTTTSPVPTAEPAVVVRSGAPVDSLLGDGAWFEGPTGVVRDAEGRVVLVGIWSPLDATGPGTVGMRPLPDPAATGETYGC